MELAAVVSLHHKLPSPSCIPGRCPAQSKYKDADVQVSPLVVRWHVWGRVSFQGGLVEIEAIAALGPLSNAL